MTIEKKRTGSYFPNKGIRQSQLISPWGVGAMIDFPSRESLMICGLDLWRYPSKDQDAAEFMITEERLQKRLGTSHFRLPPDFREPGDGITNPQLMVPSIRFPEWHICEWCDGMEKLTLFGTQQRCSGEKFLKGKSCNATASHKRRFLVPLRFIAACEKGHITDFPWLQWAHNRDKKPVKSSCTLKMWTGSSASLAGLNISCSCGSHNNMAGSFNEDSLKAIINCGGQRPWLGDVEHMESRCGLPLKVLQKGGSNVFFPLTVSSIYLPLWAEGVSRDIIAVLEDAAIWGALTSSTVDGQLDETKCKFTANMKGLDPEQFTEFAKRKFEGFSLIDDDKATSEEEFRQDEYTALIEGRGNLDSDLSTRIMDTSAYNSPINDYVSNLTSVDQLRETKVFAGFSRVIPESEYNLDDKINLLKLSPSIDWLPASIVHGEGIFFKLDESKIDSWSSQADVIERTNKLAGNYYRSLLKQGKKVNGNIPPKLVLLHTLAHLLINQLSFDCGYGSSSLRERIYCDTTDEAFPMSGILIYTASGDSEGTMGGLVRQGLAGQFEKIFARALNNALWCSSDPICLETEGQGPGSCNLAACHGCALLPETSCESGNKLLDRVLVVGSPNEPGLGFFSNFLASTL
ncbi:MAG: DUF1998 domain-containing protein [Pyrinomonadaceae bacterium]